MESELSLRKVGHEIPKVMNTNLFITDQLISSKMSFPQKSHLKYYGWNLKYGKCGFSDIRTLSVDNHPSLHVPTVFLSRFTHSLSVYETLRAVGIKSVTFLKNRTIGKLTKQFFMWLYI